MNRANSYMSAHHNGVSRIACSSGDSANVKLSAPLFVLLEACAFKHVECILHDIRTHPVEERDSLEMKHMNNRDNGEERDSLEMKHMNNRDNGGTDILTRLSYG
uniref:Uncharacterized protein n=1 Tax=Ascaris lumbricoides TaxID=6252 RepID=A0A0M3I7Q3_ASCLU